MKGGSRQRISAEEEGDVHLCHLAAQAINTHRRKQGVSHDNCKDKYTQIGGIFGQ